MTLVIEKEGKLDKPDWINNFTIVAAMLSALNNKVGTDQLGANSGVATLNNLGKMIQTALNSEKLDNKTFAEIANLFVAVALLGAANGVATLGSDGKLTTAQIPSSISSGLVPKGNWNATTNSPAIPAASGANVGWFYIVGVAGSTTISGISTWAVGDWIISNGSAWERVPFNITIASITGLQAILDSKATMTGGKVDAAVDADYVGGSSIGDIAGMIADAISDAVAALVDSAPSDLNTLGQLADALNNKVDVGADAILFTGDNLHTLAGYSAGDYYISNITGMHNVPDELAEADGAAFVRVVRYIVAAKVELTYENGAVYSQIKQIGGYYTDWKKLNN
jgi:hypothetical protein